jgi:hypothetical protein
MLFTGDSGEYLERLCSLSSLIEEIVQDFYWAQTDLESVAHKAKPICQALDAWNSQLTVVKSSLEF